MIPKSRKPGKEIRTYEEFVRLSPKNIYLEKSTWNDWDMQIIEANTIQSERQFIAMANGPYAIYEVVEEYYPENIEEFAEMLQQLKDEYNEDLSLLENAEKLFNKGYRIEVK